MRKCLAALGLIAGLTAGCSTPTPKQDGTTRLHALEGPLASANPGLVIPVASKGRLNDGTIAYVLPDGESCKGKWSLITGRMAQAKGAESGQGELQIMAKNGGYAPRDGGGGYVSHGNNEALGQGQGNCSKGATFEFAFKANGHQARGALRDSAGNVFRIVLR